MIPTAIYLNPDTGITVIVYQDDDLILQVDPAVTEAVELDEFDGNGYQLVYRAD